MIKNLNFGLLTAIVLLLFCQNGLAQTPTSAPAPAISTKYDNAQIEKMIQSFRMEYSRDIMPPELLHQKFMQDFPENYDVEWETAANLYEVEFEIRGADYNAYYDGQANLIMYKYDIYMSDLPDLITNKVKSDYPDYRFDDMEKILRGTEVLYKIELEKGDYDVKLLLKDDGTIINKMVDF